MKTAISIPDDIFEEAERTAGRLGMSRSELFTKAVAAFLEARRGARITEALDRVYGDAPTEVDPELAKMQSRTMRRRGEKW